MKINGKLYFSGFCVLIFILMLGTAASASEEKMITGTVISAPEDSSGKLAPIALECNDGVYGILKNSIAAKLQKKWIGKRVDVTGPIEEIEGKKIITPWLYQEAGAKPKIQPTG